MDLLLINYLKIHDFNSVFLTFQDNTTVIAAHRPEKKAFIGITITSDIEAEIMTEDNNNKYCIILEIDKETKINKHGLSLGKLMDELNEALKLT